MALCAIYARYKTSRNKVVKIQQYIKAYTYVDQPSAVAMQSVSHGHRRWPTCIMFTVEFY